GGNVHHVVRPVAPAGKKSVESPKHFLGPEIYSAFTGVALSEFNHGNSLRPKKEHQRNDPKPDGNAAICRDRGQHVQIENGNDEQKYQISLTKNPFQMRLGYRGAGFLGRHFSPEGSAESGALRQSKSK